MALWKLRHNLRKFKIKEIYKGFFVKNLFLATILLGLVACSGGKNSTGFSVINDMKYSVAYEAFTDNPVLPNGATMMQPVQGTVSRGHVPDAVDAEGNPVILENPFEMDEYAWERGEKYYNIMCSMCHGANGKGDGIVITRGGFPKPPSFSARRWKKIDRYSVGYVYNIITHGLGNMKSYSQQLYPEDRWAVAEYVRKRLMRGKEKFKQ